MEKRFGGHVWDSYKDDLEFRNQNSARTDDDGMVGDVYLYDPTSVTK